MSQTITPKFKIGLGFALCLMFSSKAVAQLTATYPMKENVPPQAAAPVDGVFKVSTLGGKRIVIDRGRGYFLDSWTQALLWHCLLYTSDAADE